jgi:hypothetical protein
LEKPIDVPTAPPARRFVCPYCLTSCGSQEALDEHLEEVFAVSVRALLDAAKQREANDARAITAPSSPAFKGPLAGT